MLPPQGEEARNRGQGIMELLQWILAAKLAVPAPKPQEDASRALFQTFGAFA